MKKVTSGVLAGLGVSILALLVAIKVKSDKKDDKKVEAYLKKQGFCLGTSFDHPFGNPFENPVYGMEDFEKDDNLMWELKNPFCKSHCKENNLFK